MMADQNCFPCIISISYLSGSEIQDATNYWLYRKSTYCEAIYIKMPFNENNNLAILLHNKIRIR
jgi:hypothetical protein